MLRRLVSWTEYGELAAMFFLQGMAAGMWLVPLSHLLDANGLADLRPFAYATSAVAAFISPLLFGATADRHASPVRVLRWLAAASAVALTLASWSIARHWPAATVLAVIQAHAIVAIPTNSIVSTIIFSRLQDSQREFGPIRAVATFGWMSGCWLVSGMSLDASPGAGYGSAVVWAALAAFTLLLPEVPPLKSGPTTFSERMGWDALTLLKHHDHRVVFLTTALFSIPLAAFYPFTPPHLEHLGLRHISAWMSLGQITEIVGMLSLAGLFMRWRLKWIFAAGLGFAVLRYVLFAMNQAPWVLAGVSLHGFSFTLFFITAQIYLNERIEAAWRARAQALMALMNGGVGNLIGYLGTGAWFQACTHSGETRWPVFWSGLALAVVLVQMLFLFAYHGRGAGLRRTAPPDIAGEAT